MPGVLNMPPAPAPAPPCPIKLLNVGRPPAALVDVVVVPEAGVEVVDPAAQGLGAGALISVVGVGVVSAAPPLRAWNGLGPPIALRTGS